MLKLIAVLSFFGIQLLLGSCGTESESSTSYFDSLISVQETRLSNSRMSLTKIASMDGKEERSSIAADSISWSNELDIFRRLSIFERPAYRKSYREEDGLKDSRSNLTIKQFTTTEEIPVTQLRFFYFNKIENLKKIEAIFNQKNLLYYTTRRMELEFEEVDNKPVMVAYKILGKQKMVFSDSVTFSIESHINN